MEEERYVNCFQCGIEIRATPVWLDMQPYHPQCGIQAAIKRITALEAELAECRLYAEQLRGVLGYLVSGDIQNNPSIKNGIAEALDQRLAECRRTLAAKDAYLKHITDESFQRGFDSAKKKAIKVFWKERNDALANGCNSLAAAELGATAIGDMEVEVTPKD